MRGIRKLIYEYLHVFTKAKRIREDEERRQKSFGFAVSAIVYSLLMIACAFLGGFLLTLSEAGILYIFLVVIAVALLGGVLIEFIGALLNIIAQFTINRKPICWIALIIFIVSIGASIFAIIHYFL